MSPSNWRLSNTIALLLALAVPKRIVPALLGHVAYRKLNRSKDNYTKGQYCASMAASMPAADCLWAEQQRKLRSRPRLQGYRCDNPVSAQTVARP